jgi:hypothetical protein
MKKTIYALCIVVCALFAVVSCSKSDDNNGDKGGITNNTFSQEVTKVVSQDLIRKMADGGATIYGGTNPPKVELPSGYLFYTEGLLLFHTTLGDKDPLKGKTHDAFFYKFYGQNGSKIKVDYFNQTGATYKDSGVDAVISGDGDKFTIFFKNKEGDLTTISGEYFVDNIGEVSIKDFQQAAINLNAANSPVGTVRVFKSEKDYVRPFKESNLYHNFK